MVKKEEFYYNSSDNKTKIHAIKWIPEGEIKSVLQIAHGMLEHMERYDEFANYLALNGILVAGNDHLGHGFSLQKEEDRGYFCDGDANKVVLDDIHNLRNILKKEYKDAPYFMLGHSMGSFLIRQYITIHNKIDGAIIVGTGQQPYAAIQGGMILTRVIASLKGWRYRSLLVNNLAIGNNNKKFEPARTPVDWLSKDEKKVDEYIFDKKIDFMFTLNSYYYMFKGILKLYDRKNLMKMPKDLPVIILSGSIDPVGNFGKDPVRLYEEYKSLGLKDVSCKLYENDRHEILNETDRKTVYVDIENWIVERSRRKLNI